MTVGPMAIGFISIVNIGFSRFEFIKHNAFMFVIILNGMTCINGNLLTKEYHLNEYWLMFL